jgi:antitoxin HigA-1
MQPVVLAVLAVLVLISPSPAFPESSEDLKALGREIAELADAMAAKLLALIPPGKILYEGFMKPMGVSINALAREMAVPLNRISEIVSGKRSITADTALRLGKYFGVSPELWLNLQVDYDLRVAKRTTWLKAEPRVRVHAD